MNVAVVTTKGQIVIPVDVRRRLGIAKGSRLAVEERNGSVVLRPLDSEYFMKLSGCARGWGLLEALGEARAEERKREEAKLGRRKRSR